MNTCTACGQPTANPTYCSRSCSATHTNRLYPKRTKRPRHCRRCGVPAHQLDEYRTLCHGCNTRHVDWSTVTLAEVRGKRQYQKHSRLRDLARKAYIAAERPMRCEACGYETHVEVCHIRATKDVPEEALVADVNAQSNLVALCPNPHWEFDHGVLTISP